MKKASWEVYRPLLDSGEVRWAANFDDWRRPQNGVRLRIPTSLIPINREVQ